MHKTLLALALLLPLGEHDDALHAIGQCPNGPNCPKPVRPQPKPAPEPAPEPPHKPKPHKPLLPDLGLGLADEDVLALLFAAGLIGAALYWNRAKANEGGGK